MRVHIMCLNFIYLEYAQKDNAYQSTKRPIEPHADE